MKTSTTTAVTFTTELTSNYNNRQRKALTIGAAIIAADGEILDWVVPGEGSHKQAKEWAEWRIESVRKDWPRAKAMRVYCGDDEIAVVTLADEEPEPTPATVNANETTELGYNEATRAAMIDAARAFLVLADKLNEQVSAYIDGSSKPEAEAAYIAVKESEANFLKYYCAYWDEPRRRPCLGYELAESSLPEDDEYFTGAA